MSIKKIAFIAVCILIGLSLNSHAQSKRLAFDVSPKSGTVLPTEIIPGQTLTAYYTVTDKTGGPFPPSLYNYVKHLPKNVTQVSVDPSIPDLCGETFILEAHGSCTLQLEISGPVSSQCIYENSDNPCLFVCMADGFTCAGTADPLEVSLVASPLAIAGGLYSSSSGAQYPMLAAHTASKGSDPWSYIIDSTGPLPTDFVDTGTFSGSACTGQTCLAVGGYSDQDGNNYPMIAVSTKGGAENSWTYVLDKSNGLPAGYSAYARFNNIACSGDVCVAGGQYQTQTKTKIKTQMHPMLAVSKQRGAKGTWNYVDTSTLLNGIINSTSCSANVCIAGGQYEDDSVFYPLLAVNTNVSGNGSWIYAIDSNTPLPTDFNNSGNIWSVACSDDVCIAGGEYNNSSPLLIVNDDISGDGTWNYAIDNTHQVPNNCSIYENLNCLGTIRGTSCSGNICAAGGNYSSGGSNYPMLAVNTQVGDSDTWNYVIDSQTLPLNYTSTGYFYALSCSGDVCAAAGQYHSDVDTPMLAMNTDMQGSGTWSYIIDADEATLPAEFASGGSFYGVTCYADLCFTQGYYDATDGSYYPMLATNLAGHWDYPLDATGPLPSQYGSAGNGYGLFCGTTDVCDESLIGK